MEIMRTRVCQPFRRIQARQIQSRPTLHHDSLAFFDSFPHFQQRNHPLSNIPTGEAAAGRLVLSALLKPAYLATSTGSDTDPEKEIHPQEPGEISDQEWEIRTGRAIYIIQQTLPDFFSTGLISSLDMPEVRTEAESKPSNGAWSLTNALGLKTKGKEKAKEEQTESESIYSPRIRLTYTPPTPLPAPLPKTLHIEGLHLYTASSIFVRHTLNALYTDLHVDLLRVRVQGSNAQNHGSVSSSPTVPSKRRGSREKSLILGITVTGISRVSSTPTQWDVNYTYTFSPITGHILHHNVDSIEPAPTQALFEALGKLGLFGSGSSGGVGGAGNAGPGIGR